MDVPSLYGDNSPYYVAHVANRLPSNDSTESTNFIIDTTTPHGDVIINESCAFKPAVKTLPTPSNTCRPQPSLNPVPYSTPSMHIPQFCVCDPVRASNHPPDLLIHPRHF